MSVAQCSHGHDMVPDNIYVNSRGAECCARCRTERSRRYDQSVTAKRRRAARNKASSPASPKRPAAEVKAEWNFMLGQAQQNGWDRRRNCFRRENEFVMYDAANTPTPAEAEAMCAGCPLFDLCAENAAVTKPGWGTWAGHVWRYGKIVRREEDMIVEDDDVA